MAKGTKELKDISLGTAVKAIITGFIAYGIIFAFLFSVIYSYTLMGFYEVAGNRSIELTVILGIIFGIILFYLMKWLCRLSTYDVLKKCRIAQEDTDGVAKCLDVFFLVVIILFIASTMLYLFLNLAVSYQSIRIASTQYETVFSDGMVEKLTLEMLEDFHLSSRRSIYSTIIFDIAFVLGMSFLPRYQRKMIDLYNNPANPKKYAEYLEEEPNEA